jgi:asparagine synthase (glutamine-hydrolysing)
MNMSAIFGILHTDGKPVAPVDLARMNSALVKHGPDESCLWQNGSVGLGQRLMRFTPEDNFEQQPLVSRDGLRVLITDARIDNRQELSVLFGLSASDIKQMPDSVFIMFAYEKWGLDCSLHLVGTYAFALWDKREQHLMLVRSPLSDRHIYYHSNATSFSFATVPKGLLVLPWIPCGLNKRAFADYLVHAPEDPGTSFYCNVSRMQMGSAVVVRRDGIKHFHYWSPDFKKELRLKNDNDYLEAFTELFERVISDNLRSITPVGVMMSGGLDSTSVAAVAASQLKCRNKRLSTFTEKPREGFCDDAIAKGRYADETPLVQAMAARYDNIDLNLVRTDGAFFLTDVTPLFEESGVPLYGAPHKVWIDAINVEAKRQNVKVLLTGGSGNMTISWDGRGLISELLRTGRWRQAWNEARDITKSGSLSSRLRSFAGRGILPILPHYLWDAVSRIRHQSSRPTDAGKPWELYSPINQAFAESQCVISRSHAKGFNFSFRNNRNTKYERFGYFEMADTPKSIFIGNKALYGVETRDPTMDTRVFDFCLSVPENQYLRSGKDRWLIRRAMADRLPDQIVNNTHRGLQSADWFERLYAARVIIEDELKRWEQSSLVSMVLDVEKLRNIFYKINKPGYVVKKEDFATCFMFQKGLMNGRFLRWLETEIVV